MKILPIIIPVLHYMFPNMFPTIGKFIYKHKIVASLITLNLVQSIFIVYNLL
ncbi:hypothetical protein HUC00_28645 [Bacillus mycoides]|nr:hypothetical protein [Bacillus mycoides]